MTNKSHFPIVGIIGGSQIARMLIEAATRLNIDIKILCKDSQESAALIANSVSIGDTNNYSELTKFALDTEVITFDAYQFSLENLKKLEEQGQLFRPSLSTVENLQDTSFIQQSLLDAGLVVKDDEVKSARELSLQVARSPHGQSVVYPVSQTKRIDDVLDEVITPAPNLSDSKASELQSIALRVSELFKIIGIFSVEFIDTGNNEFFISQIKLGPTNSGHWTIDGSITSQFEQHLRAILDLPLGDTSMTAQYAVMGNVLGGDKQDMYRPYLHLLARTPKLKVHQYRKEVKPGRKIGHVTLLGENLIELTTEVQHAIDYMGGVIDE
ncbi:MAG: ATP-grasp domain-containing protein [Actinomycetes bacterium]